MSAAEPADPERPYVNTGAAGAVIDITKHRRRGGAVQAAQGRWTMAKPPEPADRGPDRDRTPLELFAQDIETSFNKIRHTLKDDDTVAVYLKTLDVWQRVLEGARARGIITAEQLDDLLQTLAGMRQAPGLV